MTERSNPALSPFEEIVDWLGANDADSVGEREPPVTCELPLQAGEAANAEISDNKAVEIIQEEWWEKWQEEVRHRIERPEPLFSPRSPVFNSA